jgi:putative pyruvate formate lyase activating enzyme
VPLYSSLSNAEFEKKITFFKHNYSPCNLCPRRCGVDRSQKKPGACRAVDEVKIASYNLHFGEEPPISGKKGSGVIFFSGCTLACLFCQNYPISHLFNGKFYSIEELGEIFLNLQARGAHNINLVSPTPYLYHIVKALKIASEKGLEIPIVYNTGGYERVEILKKLKNVIDIYLPDFKYHDDSLSFKFSGVKNYVENAFSAFREMYAQVGDLIVDKNEIGVKGVIIRHLILPGFIGNSKKVLKKIADSPFGDIHLSLMSQYFPAYKATEHREINRRLHSQEYEQVKEYALSLNFSKGWFQPH